MNYCTHAIGDMLDQAATMRRHGHPDTQELLDFVEDVRRAEKFMLPDHGALLHDPREVPEGLIVTRLPYVLIAVEVPFPPISGVPEGQIESSRRIIVAREVMRGEDMRVRPPTTMEEPNAVRIDVVCWIDAERKWIAQPIGITALVGATNVAMGPQDDDPYRDYRIGGTAFDMAPAPLLRYTAHRIRMSGTPVQYGHAVTNDNGTELRILAEMLTALTCRNVGMRVVTPPAKLVKARARAGKKPFHDMHVLIIGDASRDGASTRSVTDDEDGFKVRQHLRRGHVRNLASGDRIWVNAAIVAAGSERGRTSKTYRMTKGT